MKRRVYIFTLVIIIVIAISYYWVNNNRYNKVKNISGYSFEYSNKDVITKTFDGELLESFVTIALGQDEFTVNLEGIDKESEVYIINPNDGDMINLDYLNGNFTVNTVLDKDITYGIIINYNLVGSIRVVDDFESLDEEKLSKEILSKLSCGIE